MNQSDPASTTLLRIAQANRSSEPCGIYSVCSAHALVLEAAIEQARDDDSPLLIEATCNQVNQFGGYTGMQPSDFADWVRSLWAGYGLNNDNLILGGDHLGPNPWKSDSAEVAMKAAETLVDAYASAGFVKIHLDASMSCADDETPLPPAVIAERSARLCAVAERAAQTAGTQPVYVIGTEVPVPGGETHGHDITAVEVTPSTRAHETVSLHQQAFSSAGLDDAFQRVVGLVVQPGVEFSDHTVTRYVPEDAQDLRDNLPSEPSLIYEAHSTDYQTGAALSRLVEDHFAILKVGPELTFALREALFALERIEQEQLAGKRCSQLRTTVENAMIQEPKHWQPYYSNDPEQARLDRIFSFSDRIRYYWQQPAVDRAVQTLYDNLSETAPSPTVAHAYLPAAVTDAFALDSGNPRHWVKKHIRQVLGRYARACRLSPESANTANDSQ